MEKISRRSFLGRTTLATGAAVFGGNIIAGNVLGAEASKVLNGSEEPIGTKNEHTFLEMPENSTVEWSFGGVLGADPFQVKSTDFKFAFKKYSHTNSTISFRQGVAEACKELDARRGKKPLALCMSGGMGSEIIGLTLTQLGIPFDIYFFDNWDMNLHAYLAWVQPFARKVNKKVNVVSLGRSYFIEEFALKAFMKIGTERPNYLALTHLFETIPSDQYIVVGDGDFDRKSELYTHIASQNPLEANDHYAKTIPMSSAAVAFDIWAAKEKRRGNFYFFRNSEALVRATLNDVHFGARYPESSVRETVSAAFPELEVRMKTSNWDFQNAQQENAYIRKKIRGYVAENPDLAWWKPAIGTKTSLEHLILKDNYPPIIG